MDSGDMLGLIRILLFIILILLAGFTSNAQALIKTSFLFYLSDFNGLLGYNWPSLAADRVRDEIFVVDRRKGDIAIFNQMGMEIHRFGDDGSLGMVKQVDVDEAGTIYVLSASHSAQRLIRCNFRGEPQSEITLSAFPQEFGGFLPEYMRYQDNRLYLADSRDLKIAVFDMKGTFQKGYDVAALIDLPEEKRIEIDFGGFNLDPEGNMFFSLPVLFAVYRLSPEGEIKGFGRSGSAPGRFGVVGGVACDAKGHIYVADRLKCVVLVFNRNFEFLMEFGYRGPKPDNLIVPNQLAVDDNGRLYVAQLGGRGVSVFKIFGG